MSPVQEGVWMSAWSFLFTQVATNFLVWTVLLMSLLILVILQMLAICIFDLRWDTVFGQLVGFTKDVDSLCLQLLFGFFKLVLSNLEMICCSQQMLEIDVAAQVSSFIIVPASEPTLQNLVNILSNIIISDVIPLPLRWWRAQDLILLVLILSSIASSWRLIHQGALRDQTKILNLFILLPSRPELRWSKLWLVVLICSGIDLELLLQVLLLLHLLD